MARAIGWIVEGNPGTLAAWILALELFAVACSPPSPRQLTFGPGSNRAPAWHPDGRWITFESNRGQGWGLYDLDTESGEVRARLDEIGDERHPSWSADGTTLVFVSARLGSPDLHLLRANQATPEILARLEGQELFPTWSPDGREIGFTAERSGSYSLRSWSRDGSLERLLVDPPARDLYARWSPDGRALALFSRRPGHLDDEIYLLEGTPPRLTRLTRREGHDYCPSWHPSGDRLALIAIEPPERQVIHVVDRAGGLRARIAPPLARVTEPTWSPDGRSIVFAGAPKPGDPYQLYRVSIR